jgi:hypothetical protein
MTIQKLQLTEFYIEKLKTVVNVGRSSAYQILTAQGTVLGQIGPVANAGAGNAANDASVEETSAGRQSPQPWIRRTLSALFAR